MVLASRRRELKWGNDARRGEGNPNFSGGKYIDDKGYIRVLRQDHKYNNRGYVYEHRLVLEEHLGRLLQPWESVHHINELKLDNRLTNLFLTTVGEHSTLHREGKRKSHEHKQMVRKNMKDAAKGRKRVGGRFVKKDE